MPNPITTAAAIGLFVGAHAIPGYAAKKYYDWRREHLKRKKGIGLDRRQFAGLSRRKQSEVMYYRRMQLRDLENIHEAGYAPVPHFQARRRRLF